LELENIILREVSQAKRPKITCSLSYVDYRPPQKCSNVIAYGAHAKGRTCMGEIVKGNLKLECG
jgi:hypothetical protein